jgi:D-3-phosphoglycerate dehydrogenase
MMTKPLILVTSRSFGKFGDDGLRILRDVGEIRMNPYDRALTEDELAKHSLSITALVLGADPCTRKVIDASKDLKVIAKHGAGYDNVDLKSATSRGIPVTYVPALNADSVADFAMGLLIALARRILAANLSTKSGEWRGSMFVGNELNGKILGIIGLGEIGSRVARRALSFGMKVMYFDVRRRQDLEVEGVSYTDLDDLLSNSDFISLHTSLTRETIGILGRSKLEKVKPGAYLVNTARGALIDQSEVARALKERRLAGAALDVFEHEPPEPNNPLIKLDNVICTPHIAAYTNEALRKIDVTLARDVVRVLSGAKPIYCANPAVFQD